MATRILNGRKLFYLSPALLAWMGLLGLALGRQHQFLLAYRFGQRLQVHFEGTGDHSQDRLAMALAQHHNCLVDQLRFDSQVLGGLQGV